MAQIERDIIAKIEQMFSPEDAAKAIAALSAAGKSGRIARCVVFAARGSMERFVGLVQLAELDYRDVIVAAEYQDMQTHIRDFRASFLIDAPMKMWISDVAAALAQRDYALSSIDAVSTENHSAGEGTATFEGDCGTIRITKKLGMWTVRGNETELERYGLMKPFGNERDFTDAVSGYILVKRKSEANCSDL
jgi:hypothetical protein